jgi:P-type Mg2+ transporter
VIIFVIRTRRTPFFRSRPSLALAATSVACVALGAAIPFTPLGRLFGFSPLPAPYFAALGGMVVTYLVMVETAKAIFYRHRPTGRPLAVALGGRERTIRRWAARWTHPQQPR